MSEPIDVIGIFRGRTVRPAKFRYAGRVHTVAKVLYTWVTREGSFPVHRFFVLTQDGNRYQVSLNTYTISWTLDQAGTKTPTAAD